MRLGRDDSQPDRGPGSGQQDPRWPPRAYPPVCRGESRLRQSHVPGTPITCFHNPDVGREFQLTALEPELSALRVLVVGAGPAGLKAAETAARRGHQVTVVDREQEAGGRLRWLARCGPAASVLMSIGWVADRLEELGVEVRLGAEVNEAFIAELAPDAVVLATGARPAAWRLPAGDGSVPVVSIEDALSSNTNSRRLLVVDELGTEEVALAAESLAASGASVSLVTPLATVGAHIGSTLIRDQLDRPRELGCQLVAGSTLVDVADGAARSRTH